MENLFLETEEKQVMDQFLNDGYVIIPIEEKQALDEFKKRIYDIALDKINVAEKPSLDDFFNQTDKYVSVDQLNQIRMAIITVLNGDTSVRPLIYSLAKKYIWWVVGSELAMQRTINLSIQLPNDDSSLLPVHSDVWMGNSPYEIVFWLPMVDCFKTKTMYVLPLKKSEEVYRNFKEYSQLNADELYESIKKDLVWLEVPYGKAVIFSHSILHGNVTNEEEQTRWSFNVRFKSLLTPYSDKSLGESFLPITARPVTKIGYQYIKPRC